VAPASAADLVAPLSLILSKVIKFPTTGNSVLDELLRHLRGAAHGVVDEAVNVDEFSNRSPHVENGN
jgi:hypothetical protein